MDSKSSECDTSPQPFSTSPARNSKNSLETTNDYGNHVNIQGSEKEYYIDMNCSFQNTDTKEGAEVVSCDIKLLDSIYDTISNHKTEEVECTNSSMKDASDDDKVYTSLANTETSPSNYAEARVGEKKTEDFLINGAKQSKKLKKLLYCFAIGVFILAVAIGFISVFVEIGIHKLSGSASSTHAEEITLELQELVANLELYNISLAGLGSPGQFSTNPVAACSTLPPSFLPGYYWVRDSVGSSVRVYCDISFSCGGVTGGWMRVAELDMTNSSHQCPGGLQERSDTNMRTCVRNMQSPGCSSIAYSTANIHYSRVCGKVIGYQVGRTNAFFNHSSPISSTYVDGVSLTHGISYEHIWTFAAAYSESDENVTASSNCHCITTSALGSLPNFVGMDYYFCDTGVHGTPDEDTLYASDPLWNGAGCEPPNTCCSFNSPPWFYRQLPQSTTDDIDMRVCRDELSTNEDIAIETVQIYIQ